MILSIELEKHTRWKWLIFACVYVFQSQNVTTRFVQDDIVNVDVLFAAMANLPKICNPEYIDGVMNLTSPVRWVKS